ncbi:hypothetical protein MAR_037989 [Mya arenaria]|uniref:Uncharacterized protein n=1 Tax=Mya arenaria TaxID=6604 RepID=A0ABY7FQ35_MYAAR|nr:uncharacterized protein LOC128213884 [Mya arenaria]WAR24320.1 hypothetical protein MAR_037989 [Mya arenaria]
MGEKEASNVQQEINRNLSSVSSQPFAMTPEEMEFNNRMAKTRGLGKRSSVNKMEQQRNTQNWVNRSAPGVGVPLSKISGHSGASLGHKTAVIGQNCAIIGPNNGQIANNFATVGQTSSNLQVSGFAENINQAVISTNQQNNRTSSESIVTIRENFKNSQESFKRRSSDNVLTIEEASRDRSPSFGSAETINARNTSVNVRRSESPPKRPKSGSVNSLCSNTEEIRPISRSNSIMDPHTAAIDLSNNCRKFYFNHIKSAEAIKKAVRAAKHNRAREKMEGHKCSTLDTAMDRLRAEMADLMEQDLSLMSQMLKLNDKIEDIKAHVSYRNRLDAFGSSMSTSEVSDSEYSDTEESRLDLYNASTGSYRMKTLKSLNHISNASLHPPELGEGDKKGTDGVMEESGKLKKLARAGSDIIVYRKKVRKGKKRERNRRNTEDEESNESGGESEDSICQSSDTESTLSCNSDSTKAAKSDQEDSDECFVDDTPDSGIQSPKPEQTTAEPLKPRKGGVSHNSCFLNFHKSNGARSVNPLSNDMLTLQGHNISLEKYYVPQGLVYLKHANAENVFCQFTK